MLTSKKQIFFWVLYDFANSLAFIAVSFYFALWFVSDLKGSSIWVSIPVALATLLLLLLTLPALGRISDKIKRRMPFLIVFTLLAVASLFLLGIVGNNTSSLTLPVLVSIMLLYFLFQYFYQAALAFYYSFLFDISTGRPIEKVSGFGAAGGQLGNVVGLVLIFPIAQGTISLLGISGRAGTFIVAAVLFFIFSLPALIFLKDTRENSVLSAALFIRSYREIFKTFKKIGQFRGVLPFLITFYLFADAILTLQLFASLYLEKVGGIPDTQKNIAFILALGAAVVGALSAHTCARKLGSTKKAISILILLWALLLLGLAIFSNPHIFMAIVLLNGFAFGSLFTLSRAFYSQLVPIDHQGEFFSIYVLFEKFASVLGPLVWSGTIILFSTYGEAISYRFAMSSLAILVAISFFTLRLVKEK